MIRIESFIINTNLLDFMFQKINFNIFSIIEDFITHWTTGCLSQPIIYALKVKDVKTA